VGEEEPQLTADDVVELNRSAISTTARVVCQAGNVLVVLALVGVAAWLWIVARQQQLLGNDGPSGFITVSGESPFARRVDIFAGSVGFLLNVGLVGGLGLGLRLAAENVMLRTGGTLSGLEAGALLAEDVGDDADDLDDDD
jgi:hypothetical protein